MSLDPLPILNAVESHAKAAGVFERVNRHESDNSPGNGLTADVWVQRISAIALHSGLAATSARLLLTVRVKSNMLAEPRDMIDPNLTAAVATLMIAISADFQLGGTVAFVDLLGNHGIAFDAQAGYLPQDGATFRVMDLSVPAIVNDVFPQEA